VREIIKFDAWRQLSSTEDPLNYYFLLSVWNCMRSPRVEQQFWLLIWLGNQNKTASGIQDILFKYVESFKGTCWPLSCTISPPKLPNIAWQLIKYLVIYMSF
jgi:hypothetical protein